MKTAKRWLKAFALIALVLGLTAVAVQFYRVRIREAVKPASLFAIIQEQVSAFRADDYASAYQRISTGFQERFNIEAFTDMAHADYPSLRFADRIEFGAVRWDGHMAIVPTYFFLPDGEVVPCLYTMIQEDGSWKIDGVRVQKRWPAGRRLGGLRA